MKKLIVIVLLISVFTLSSCKEDKVLSIATTTSLDNSGLLDYIIPTFETTYGIDVQVIAVGTGAALELGKQGEVEILLVHDYEREVQFVTDDYGVKRANIMYNDFILVGPEKLEVSSLDKALEKIILEHQFYSRGDQSGTHSKELSIWNEYGYDPSTFEGFYFETGQGMGSTIQMAELSGYYTLTDRATYLSMLDGLTLEIAYENPVELKNQYGVIKINPDLYDTTDDYADLFYDWIQSSDTQALIASYEKYNTKLFYID